MFLLKGSSPTLPSRRCATRSCLLRAVDRLQCARTNWPEGGDLLTALHAIKMWSVENAGTFDMKSEVELWVRVARIKIKFGSQVGVRKIDRLISACVLMFR